MELQLSDRWVKTNLAAEKGRSCLSFVCGAKPSGELIPG